MSNLLYH